MDAAELAALDAAIAELTRQAPDRLVYTEDGPDAERFESELGRQLALGDEYGEDDVDLYLEEVVFEADPFEAGVEEIVATNAYPRDAGMASGLYQAVKALRLPSGATLYFSVGEWETNRIRAVSARPLDDDAAEQFGEVIALPTYFYAGGVLLEIDRHLSVCTPRSWVLEALLEREAEWIEQEMLDAGEKRRDQLQRAIDDSAEEGDADPAQLRQAQRSLDATPPWFLLLTDAQLQEIAELPQPSKTHHLANTYHPWTKPTAEMFLQPQKEANRQHIVAAYLQAR